METGFSQQNKEETDDFFFFKLEDKWDTWGTKIILQNGATGEAQAGCREHRRAEGEGRWEGQQEDRAVREGRRAAGLHWDAGTEIHRLLYDQLGSFLSVCKEELCV